MQLSGKLALRVAAIGVSGAAILAPFTAAQAGTGPSLSAAPNTALTNNQSVEVSGTGFAASSPYFLTECSGLTGQSACDTNPADLGTGTTGADGSISTTFTVHTGTIGDGTCDSTHPCYLVATTNPTDPTAAGVAPIAFAPTGPVVTVVPDSNVKNGQTVSVSGSGFPAKTEAVYVVECGALGGQADCDTSTLGTGSTNASGSFSGVKVTVHTGAVGDKTCKAGGTCYIVATTDISGKDLSQVGASPFTFAKAGPSKATVTKAKYHHHKVVGKVTSSGKGIKGLKTVLEIRKHGHWKKVATMKTHKGGAFASSKLHKAGKYEVKTPKQTKGSKVYKSSHSKAVTVKA